MAIVIRDDGVLVLDAGLVAEIEAALAADVAVDADDGLDLDAPLDSSDLVAKYWQD